jgi:predicted DNA-binding WGR domain protein
MPRYEFVEGNSSKFWEIKLKANAVTTTYGRLGTEGQSTCKEYESGPSAQKEYEKLIASKEKKGYVLVGGGAITAPKKAPAPKSKEPPPPKKAATKTTTKAKASAAAAPAGADHGPRRYEFVEDGSSKFWEITLEGVRVLTTYGRIGSEGKITVKEYDGSAVAQKEYDKLVASKEKKGYERIS